MEDLLLQLLLHGGSRLHLLLSLRSHLVGVLDLFLDGLHGCRVTAATLLAVLLAVVLRSRSHGNGGSWSRRRGITGLVLGPLLVALCLLIDLPGLVLGLFLLSLVLDLVLLHIILHLLFEWANLVSLAVCEVSASAASASAASASARAFASRAPALLILSPALALLGSFGLGPTAGLRLFVFALAGLSGLPQSVDSRKLRSFLCLSESHLESGFALSLNSLLLRNLILFSGLHAFPNHISLALSHSCILSSLDS